MVSDYESSKINAICLIECGSSTWNNKQYRLFNQHCHDDDDDHDDILGAIPVVEFGGIGIVMPIVVRSFYLIQCVFICENFLVAQFQELRHPDKPDHIHKLFSWAEYCRTHIARSH